MQSGDFDVACERSSSMAESVARMSDLSAVLADLTRALARNSAKELTPDELVDNLIQHILDMDAIWDDAPDQLRADSLTIAFAGLIISRDFLKSGVLIHIVGPWMNFRAYRSGLLITRKACGTLEQFVKKHASEKDAIRVAARVQLNSKFFEETRRLWESRKKGSAFTHLTTDELRKRAQQAHN